jgi:hypothetical protein
MVWASAACRDGWRPQLEVGSLVELTIPLPRLTRTLWRIHHRQKHISKALQRFLHYCDV